MIERAHVVQAVGKFHQNHAHVIAQREQHLAEVFRLVARTFIVAHPRNFCESVDDGPFALAEQILNVIECYFGVFNRIMQQSAYNAGSIETNFFGSNFRNGDGVVDVWLATLATHVFVRLRTELKRLANAHTIGARLGAVTNTKECTIASQNFSLLFF